HRIPVASEFGEFAQAGTLMSFGPSILDQFRYAARYVDQLFKGARPSDLPVEQATRFELLVNLTTAKALGVMIPPAILSRADEVIECLRVGQSPNLSLQRTAGSRRSPGGR